MEDALVFSIPYLRKHSIEQIIGVCPDTCLDIQLVVVVSLLAIHSILGVLAT